MQRKEVIGSNIWCYGVFELVVLEAISRLLDEGECALDVGANIGQMTSLMRRVSGPAGKVFAFEPHPLLFEELSEQVKRNSRLPGRALVELYQLALSDREGEAFLMMSNGRANNMGTGKINPTVPPSASVGVKVRTARLDKILPRNAQIEVCKIDVEGLELGVFQGAGYLLDGGFIRDIIFEELQPYPSRAHEFLESKGYKIYELHSTLRRPLLIEAREKVRPQKLAKTDNYLATLAPARAHNRYSAPGWKSLKGGAGAWKSKFCAIKYGQNRPTRVPTLMAGE